MLESQKLTLRQSEIRQRLLAIGQLSGDDYSAEVKQEEAGLQTEFSDNERRYRSALIAEGDEEARQRAEFGTDTGETGERGRLLREVRMSDYLSPAAAGAGIEGRARELNQAFELPLYGKGGGVLVPWEVFEVRGADGKPIEHRAFTTTTQHDGAQLERPYLQRLFGPGVADTLGVRFDSVPAGRSEWPLITAGVAPVQTAESTAAAAAVAATVSTVILTPKKLTGRYEFTHNAAASSPGLEAALRRDLVDAARANMQQSIINGADDSSNPERVEGFLTRLTGSDLGTGQATATLYGSLHAMGVDGLHASMETEVSSVVGDETYRHAAGVVETGSSESGSELLKRRSRVCMASTYIPAIASKKQSAILHAAGANGGTMRGDSVAAVWPGMEVIRDPYSKASQGVVLTYVALWDCRTAFRAAAYKQIDIQVQA